MHATLLDLSRATVAAAGTGELGSVQQATAQVWSKLATLPARNDETAGRKATDIAFNLALAGVTDEPLLTTLYERAEAEVRRPSRRKPTGLALAQMAERAAASGCRSPAGLYEAILERLDGTAFAGTREALSSGTLTLHSPLAARWIRRQHHHHSISAAGRRPFAHAPNSLGSTSGALDGLFDDPSLELTVDIGCGFGLGPLGISLHQPAVNVLGVDANKRALCFASGIAMRWGVAGRCAFLCDDAATILRSVRCGEYGGRLASRLVLSCPTPYAIDVGGTTFPRASAETLDYIAAPHVFDEAVAALQPGGTLHLAANVEDVAIRLYEDAVARGLEPVLDAEANSVVGAPSSVDGTALAVANGDAPPRRRAAWRASGGARAEGPQWTAGQRILQCARSETELACLADGQDVYRVVLRKPVA